MSAKWKYNYSWHAVIVRHSLFTILTDIWKKMKTVLLISHPRKLRRVQTRTEREDTGRKNSAFWRKKHFFQKSNFLFFQLLVSHLKVRKHCPPVHGIQNSRVRVDQLCRLPGHFLAKIRHDMWDNYFRGDSFLDFFTK